jgi:stage V sporulation protein AE
LAKRKVVVITDGDRVAQKVVEKVARNVGGRAISLSGGNPTPVSGCEIAAAIKKTPHDPVLVMIDDCGCQGEGCGERALVELANQSEIEILGVVAVASNTAKVEGAKINAAVTRDGAVIDRPVDKDGNPQPLTDRRLHGDTVDILNRLPIPVVIGIGDLGKMNDADLVEEGARITTQAVQEVLNRSNFQAHSKTNFN